MITEKMLFVNPSVADRYLVFASVQQKNLTVVNFAKLNPASSGVNNRISHYLRCGYWLNVLYRQFFYKYVIAIGTRLGAIFDYPHIGPTPIA